MRRVAQLETEKRQLHDYLLRALVAPEYSCNFGDAANVLVKLTLFIPKPMQLATNSRWTAQDNRIYIGYKQRNDVPLRDCLLVLLALTQFATQTPELEKAKTKALLAHLSGEAGVLNKAALIEAPVPMEGVAFTDDKVAMLLAGEWLTASGETVDVTGWKVYANQLPEVKTGVTK